MTFHAFNRGSLPSWADPANAVTIRYSTTAAETDLALVAASTTEAYCVTRCSIIVSAAVSVDVAAIVGLGATTTPTTTGVVAGHPGIKALTGGGVIEGNGNGSLGNGSVGDAIRLTSGVPTSGSLIVVLTYIPGTP